jgi:hypothetical protein
MPLLSPYTGIPPERWAEETRKIVNRHPLKQPEFVDVVLLCWKSLLDSRIGTKGFRIGTDIRPKPQIMGFFLEQLIALELATRHPDHWCAERTGADKDLVYLPDADFSVEIKTSSHPRQVFGNRSYAQAGNKSKKSKAGYYLAVNFQKFTDSLTPQVVLIRFGWLDHTDWIGQKAATGQQARIAPNSEAAKLLTLYSQE